MKTKPNQTSKIILIFVCFFSLLFIACKNNEEAGTPNLAQKENIVVKNGRLAFKNRASYESLITIDPLDTVNGEKTASVELRTRAVEIKYPGFTSMLDDYNASHTNSRLASDTMLINDPTLAALVNPDGILEIGEWICKINPAKSQVTVLNEADENLYNDLVNDVSNPKIYIFSTNDDVLDLLEDGQTQSPSTSNYRVSIFCGGGADKSEAKSQIGTALDNREISGYSAYKKFGVYFHLYTTGILYGPKDGSLVIQHTHAYYYKTNCKNYSESGPYVFTNDLYTRDYNYNEGNSTYDCVQEIYMSTRGLSDYIVAARYIYKGTRVDVPLIERH